MNWAQLLRILRGRIWLISVVFLATVVTALAIRLWSPSQYTASTTVIINFQTPNSSDTTLPASLQADYMSTQLSILASREVALRVAASLDDHTRAAVLADGGQSPLSAVLDSLGISAALQWLKTSVNSLITPPESVANSVNTSDSQAAANDQLLTALLNNLTVDSPPGTRLVSVQYTSNDPILATRLANAFSKAYQETNLNLVAQPAQRNAKWIDNQLAGLRTALEQAQRRLATYQERKGILDPGGNRLDAEAAHLNALTTQLADAETESENAQSQLRELNAMIAAGIPLDTLPEVLSNTYIQSLKADLRNKEADLADIATQYGSRHPQYRRALAEVNNLKSKLKDETQSILASEKNQVNLAVGRAQALRQAQQATKAKLLQLKQKQNDLPALTRDVDSAQRNYDNALAQYQQYRMLGHIQQTNVTIMTPASIPTTASSPGIKRTLAFAAALGLMMGVGIAVGRELSDRRVRHEDDLETATEAPVLGRVLRA